MLVFLYIYNYIGLTMFWLFEVRVGLVPVQKISEQWLADALFSFI